jgi:N-acetylmuramoyl-L-alanine amidase
MTKVFINPGHSLNCSPDPGAVGNGFKEAEIAAKIGKALDTLLKSDSFETEVYQQTGAGTANSQLNTAIQKANASKANLLISIHMNSATATAKGVETFYCLNSIQGKKFAEDVNNELAKPFENYTFSNRGVKSDDKSAVGSIGILRKTSPVACLVELGFISNKEEANFVNSNIDKIAERLYKGICTYCGVEPKIKVSNTEEPNNEKLVIKLEHQGNGKYNCYINDELKLKENKFQTCINWLSDNYSV